MSWEAQAWVRTVATGRASDKTVLIVLASYADEADECYPSQETIARVTELDRATVQRSLNRLEQRGLIKVVARYLATGGQTSNRYRLVTGGPHSEGPPSSAAGGAAPRGGGGRTVRHEQSLEQSHEQEVRPSVPEGIHQSDVWQAKSTAKAERKAKKRQASSDDDGSLVEGRLADTDRLLAKAERALAAVGEPESGSGLANYFAIKAAVFYHQAKAPALRQNKSALSDNLVGFVDSYGAAVVRGSIDHFFKNRALAVPEGQRLWRAYLEQAPDLLGRVRRADVAVSKTRYRVDPRFAQ